MQRNRTAMTAHLGEFERIAQILAPLAEGFPGALGLTDDAALIAPPPGRELAVTTDTMVEGVHFIGDEPPGLIAAKLLRVNLSDLAAMGAAPLAYWLNMSLPAATGDDWLRAFAAGLAADQRAFDIALAGGDSTGTPGPVCLTLTAMGSVPQGRALRRGGAGEGDIVYVSGSIGDAALGLKILKGRPSYAEASEGLPSYAEASEGRKASEDRKASEGSLADLSEEDKGELVGRYRLPRPRVGLGLRLVGMASAAIDISDGLAADLGHILDASGVGAEIEATAVPLSEAARNVLDRAPELLTTVLSGGDDYELLVVMAPGYAGKVERIANDLSLPLTPIGRIVADRKLTITGPDGTEMELPRKGWVHGG